MGGVEAFPAGTRLETCRQGTPLGAVPELPLGVKGAALKACGVKVDFLEEFEGVNDGDSTLKAFLDLLKGVSWSWLAMRCVHRQGGRVQVIYIAAKSTLAPLQQP